MSTDRLACTPTLMDSATFDGVYNANNDDETSNVAAHQHQLMINEALTHLIGSAVGGVVLAAAIRHRQIDDDHLLPKLPRAFYGRNYTAREAFTRALISNENSRKLYQLTRMTLPAFEVLLAWLTDQSLVCNSKGALAVQKLVIFLIISGQGSFYRAVAYQFSHSCSTISTYYHEILSGLVKLH